MKEIRLKRNNANNPQIREYTEAIRRGSRSQHIVPSKNEGWVVVSDDNKNRVAFDKKSDAVNHARRIALDGRSSLFIHSKNGRIAEREDYGIDSHPPKEVAHK